MSFETLHVSSSHRNELLDISPEITHFLNSCHAESGLLTVFVPHTTAAVTINENADPDVKTDMTQFLSKMIPRDPAFRHFEGNSDSHIKTTLVSPCLTLIIEKGKPVLGTWQSVFFCEFDGPRQRKVYLKFIKG